MNRITLRLYQDCDFAHMETWLPAFYAYHAHLLHKEEQVSREDVQEAVQQWQEAFKELYIIQTDAIACGFLQLDCEHSSIVRLENLFVEEQRRCQGIATHAIQEMEQMLSMRGELRSICIEVAPRNAAALHLYHALGYDNLCLMTVRKEWKDNPRDQTIEVLDHTFHM